MGRPSRSSRSAYVKPANRELGRDVERGVLVDLAARDRSDVDDVPPVADVRHAEPRHADQPVDVRLQHHPFVLFRTFPERVPPEREAGVVDEDVQPPELLHARLDEPLGGFRIRNVQLVSERALRDQIGPARTGGDGRPRGEQSPRRRRADTARSAGDDRGLVVESRHDARL